MNIRICFQVYLLDKLVLVYTLERLQKSFKSLLSTLSFKELFLLKIIFYIFSLSSSFAKSCVHSRAILFFYF